MNALSPSLSLMSQAAPTAQATPGDDAPGHGFARCLDQAREHDASEAAARPSAKAPAPKDTVRGARAGDAPRQTKSAEASPKEVGRTDADRHDVDADVDSDGASAPDLAALLPGWTPPGAAPPIAASAEDHSELPQAGTAAVGAKYGLPSSRDGADAQALARLAATPAAGEASDTAAMNALTPSEQQRAATPEALRLQTPTLPAGAWSSAAATTIAGTPPSVELLPTASLPAPLDSPAFAPALATQVRWWAQDGVQQAQLTLNPAEMGPVTVQITLDGREARIDFRADLAATRSALEAALPALAAALDESGLTLTGGGVHDGQTPRHNAPPSAERGGFGGATRAGGNPHDSSDTPRSPPSAARGLVDLIA